MFLKTASHGSGNRGLSRSCHTIQPEYAFVARIARPCLYLVEEVDTGIGMASRIVLLGARESNGALFAIGRSIVRVLTELAVG